MKKLSSLLLSALMVLTMTQCKKDTVSPEQIPGSGEQVYLTVTADNGSGSGAKIDITNNGTSLSVAWTSGDKLYVVGATSGYLGYVTSTVANGNRATFGGEIIGFEPQVLYFYYLGKAPAKVPNLYDKTMVIDFNNQDGTMETLEDKFLIYSGHTAEAVSSEMVSVNLYSMIAIGYFDLSSYTPNAYLYGKNIYKEVELNLAGGSFNLSSANSVEAAESAISLGTGTGSYYVALVPANDVEMSFTNGARQKDFAAINIESAKYYHYYGSTISTLPYTMEGAVKGVFSVSATKQVRFSQGNLQYIGTAATPYWKFADNQYDYIGASQAGDAENIDRDLFGWGTSGQATDAVACYPYSTSTTAGDYYPGGSATSDLTYDNKADWGYNAISNGGNMNKRWRTLSNVEWDYLINTRNDNASYAGEGNYLSYKCRLTTGRKTYNGLMILQDNSTGYQTANNFTTAWQNCPELTSIPEGAVFLPSAGTRDVGNNGEIGWIELSGLYWSSSHYDGDNAYRLVTDGSSYPVHRGCGFSVRLVQGIYKE